ncbi:hemolysin III [Pseudoscardovia radai]|uniref:Hemolysin III n=1 Tax=Pseudoscardovia radai TaxID=987066 RepID=A0A261EV53_9BIFI|nr:hemolysin III family protein [Pseudoscardovia radai]OZG50536.1 hemolysin III [Pseudoscardovia radai]
MSAATTDTPQNAKAARKEAKRAQKAEAKEAKRRKKARARQLKAEAKEARRQEKAEAKAGKARQKERARQLKAQAKEAARQAKEAAKQAAADQAKKAATQRMQKAHRPRTQQPDEAIVDLDHATPSVRQESAGMRRAEDLAAMRRLGNARHEDYASAVNYDIARARRQAARKEVAAAQRQAIQRGIAIEPTDYFGEHHPRMRGWMHAAMFPLSIAATVTLICLAPPGAPKLACALYAASSMLLFGVSACLHLVHWRSKRKHEIMCSLDYSNIFLTIAGTNTPIAMALPASIRWPYLAFIWAAAIIGTVAHLTWKKGPDWFFTIIYCVLGLAVAVLLPLLWNQPAGGPAVCWLIIAGGACYIAGAVCFALRKPILVPGWFEYHEMFHLGTLLGWSCHCVAVYLVILAL